MSYSPQYLDDLRARVSLAEVIGQRVRLERRGREYVGLCPFHKEKTPSFNVVEDKGFYHCFGCGAHGDVIGFVMQTRNIGFDEAVKIIEREADPFTIEGEATRPQITTRPSTGPLADPSAPFLVRKLDAILGTAAKMLVLQQEVTAASILANGAAELVHWDHDNWNGGFDRYRLRLAIPTEVYLEIEDAEAIERAIDKAIATVLRGLDTPDEIEAKIVTALDEDRDWREKTRQFASRKRHHKSGPRKL